MFSWKNFLKNGFWKFDFTHKLFSFSKVDMLSLSNALEQFDSHGLRAQNDKLIDIPDMVTVLTSLYEIIAADNPTQVLVPLCIDRSKNRTTNYWSFGLYRIYSYPLPKLIINKTNLDIRAFVLIVLSNSSTHCIIII